MEIKDIENLAELAKIELTDVEKEMILKDLDGVLGYVKQIESVEVGDIKPEYSNRNIWREDAFEPSRDFSANLVTGQFPDSQDGFIKVKKIL